MRIISFIILFLSITINAFAIIPIYCPKEKIHLYDYQKDEILPQETLHAKDFVPVRNDIKQPVETDGFRCPLCNASLNGWEWYAEYNHYHVKNMCGVVSVLTKDDAGFKWIPFDVPETEYTKN